VRVVPPIGLLGEGKRALLGKGQGLRQQRLRERTLRGVRHPGLRAAVSEALSGPLDCVTSHHVRLGDDLRLYTAHN
jgi:hypothetical protein